ncbi:MAG: hypothetical protein EAX86_11235 [Candidatus Heimdallarchaeota archaeon]|nr:hypothetical protein [Candidatus Heimdallarchaeota archaeon]
MLFFTLIIYVHINLNSTYNCTSKRIKLYEDGKLQIIVKHYEPEKGYEEIQASIYNEATKLMGTQVNITPEQIKQRYQGENPDPKGIRYVFNDEGTPLAYIQTRVTESVDGEKRTYIGYPWGTKMCPQAVKEQLFEEVFNYIQKRDPDSQLVMGYWMSTWKEPIAFAKKKGFEIVDENPQFAIDVKKVPSDVKSIYQSKMAIENDIPLLVDLIKSDPVVNKFFPHEQAIEKYFSERVIPDGHTFMIFRKELLVCAGAPLEGFSAEGVLLRFSAQRPAHDNAWNYLIKVISQHFFEENWQDQLFIVSPSGNESRRQFLKEIGARIHTNQLLFELKRD